MILRPLESMTLTITVELKIKLRVKSSNLQKLIEHNGFVGYLARFLAV